MGFAIPVNDAVKVFDDLVEYGYVRGRVDAGIDALEISDTATAYMYRVSQLGVYVYGVDSGSSAQAQDLSQEIIFSALMGRRLLPWRILTAPLTRMRYENKLR